MPSIKVVDNNIENALKECKKLFGDIKRTKQKYLFFMRRAVKKREKSKRAILKRKFY